jgi:hypothetical protein
MPSATGRNLGQAVRDGRQRFHHTQLAARGHPHHQKKDSHIATGI